MFKKMRISMTFQVSKPLAFSKSKKQTNKQTRAMNNHTKMLHSDKLCRNVSGGWLLADQFFDLSLETTIVPKTESIVPKTESTQRTISLPSTAMLEIKVDPSQVNATSSSSIMIRYIVAGVASSLFLLLCLALSCWYYKFKQRKISRR